MDSRIHIAAAADDNFAPYLAVTILSSVVATRSARCVFHLVDNDLSPRCRTQIEAMAKAEGAEVYWYRIDTEAYMKASLVKDISRATYYRIGLPDLLPFEVERLLYLDSDLIVMKDLTPLYEADMGENTIAAVQDVVVPNSDHLGLAGSVGYFNAGILLIDVRRWRERGIAALVADRIAKGVPTRWADQCHLNAVLNGDWQPLPAHWNYQAHKLPEEGLRRTDLTDELYFALTDPSIVHFCSNQKPWLLQCRHPYRGIYRRFLRRTPWANAPAPDRSFRNGLIFVRNLFRYPTQFPVRL